MKRRRKKKKLLMVIIIIIIAIFCSWLFLIINVNPVIRTISEEEVRALTTEAVNNAASQVMNSNAAYSELIDVSKDNNGKITLIQANTILINMLARNITIEAQKNIAAMGKQGVSIPIGSLSGISMLAGQGFDIKIKVLPIGSVVTGFDSKFSAAGINQTKHRILMTVNASVSVVVPGMDNSLSTSTEVMISECIIIGEVPLIYFQSNKLEDLLNLVP